MMDRKTIAVFNVLVILKNSNPPLLWTELYGSKAFKYKSDLHTALKRCISAGLIQSAKAESHHIFSITSKGRIFLETFAPNWKVVCVRRRIRRRPVLF